MSIVSIADILIKFSGFTSQELSLKKFALSGLGDYLLRIDLKKMSSHGFVNHYGVGYFSSGDDLFINQSNHTYALINSDKSYVVVCMSDDRHDSISDITAAMLSVCLVKFDVLMIHASLVDLDGEGILFIGMSGIGKTTQAEQWQMYRGAVIINGDNVFIRKCEDGFWGYGSPWHGSSPYCENRKTKLRAIVALRQSPDNRIVRLSGLDAILEAESSVFLPKWRKEEMEAALPIFDELLKQVPMYLLECRVDEEAVDLCYREVFGI